MKMVWCILLGGGIVGLAVPSVCGQSPFGGPAIVGKIIWPGHDVSQAQVRLYRDAAMTDLADAFPVGGEQGTFVALVTSGDYYLMALVDANGTGKLDPGDAVGYFADEKTGTPKAIRLAPDGFVTNVQIAISATVGPDGKPAPLKEGVAKVETKPSGMPAIVSGALLGREGLTVPAFVVLVKTENGSPTSAARVEPEAPGFSLAVDKGDYYLLAVADTTGDGKIGPGDRIGVHGVADWSQLPQDTPRLSLGDGDEVAGLEVAMTGLLGQDGTATGTDATVGLKVPPLPAVLCGRVHVEGQASGAVQVRVSSDPALGQVVAIATAREDGGFVVSVPSGTYYLTAICDANPDGTFGPGDLVGFHGVSDLESGAPKPLSVTHGSIASDIAIVLVGRVTEEKGLAPIVTSPEAKGAAQP